MYLYRLKRPTKEESAPNGQRSLHQGRYTKKLVIITINKEIPGIKNSGTRGLVKILKPVKGFIICVTEKLQKIANKAVTEKKIHRIIVAALYEISILYFTFFCFLTLDLNLILEVSSCKAPTGQAKLQNMRPKNSTVSSNIVKIITMGRMAIMGTGLPIFERIV